MRSFTRGSSIAKGTESGIRALDYKGVDSPPLIFAFCVLTLVGHFVMLFSAETVPSGNPQELLWRAEVEVRLETRVSLTRASPASPIVTSSAGEQFFYFSRHVPLQWGNRVASAESQ